MSAPRILDHVAFVVRSLEEAVAGLDLPAEPPRSYPRDGTRECYLGEAGEPARILLIQPEAEDDAGPYAAALKKRGAGLHHVALRVADLRGFLGEVVDGSGWLVHPRTIAQGERRAIWLARPGVEALVELYEGHVDGGHVDGGHVEGGHVDGVDGDDGAARVEAVQLAGLDGRPGLARIFAGCGVEVTAGPASGVRVAGRLIRAPEAPAVDVGGFGDGYAYNREAWNRQVRGGNRWTVGVSAEQVQRAREGTVEILLTPNKHVPRDWLGELGGADVLCLASGGGQQGPLLAAAGARVTVLDASEAQLERDREVAAREGLAVDCLQGDMRDLSALDDGSIDLIVHPCSNCFVAEIAPVWREAARVLRPGGHLLSGFNNPVNYCFDWASVERGEPRLRHRLPYRDLANLESPFVARMIAGGEPIEFSHTLAQQLDGQAAAGLAIVGLYEDGWGSGEFPDAFFDAFIATRARKLGPANGDKQR